MRRLSCSGLCWNPIFCYPLHLWINANQWCHGTHLAQTQVGPTCHQDLDFAIILQMMQQRHLAPHFSHKYYQHLLYYLHEFYKQELLISVKFHLQNSTLPPIIQPAPPSLDVSSTLSTTFTPLSEENRFSSCSSYSLTYVMNSRIELNWDLLELHISSALK